MSHGVSMTDGILDEALQRLSRTGPERAGWLSNHAPMAAEALVRHGHEMMVHRWLDGYADNLTEAPRGIEPIAPAEWRDPLGDPTRTGDWVDFFDRELTGAPWREVLAIWWPRLLPGIAAGATHGVIRVGHAVRSLLESETEPRVTEMGRGLAYWAARWQPLAAAGLGPYPAGDPRRALDAVPRVPDQRFGARNRLAQLADLSGWPPAAGAVPGTGEEVVRLRGIVTAAIKRYERYGYGSPIMLVHAATAPAAVLRSLPALPAQLAGPSLRAAWAATAAVTAAYSPAVPRPTGAPTTAALRAVRPDAPATDPVGLMDEAAATGDPHAIKFADAAVEAWAVDPDPALLAAAAGANRLISADSR